MGPPEGPTNRPQNQETCRRIRLSRRPRMRRCLLKGCETRFRPKRASERYCSDKCREAAREWSRWKAQQTYRSKTPGKEKRKAQSQRYRGRLKRRNGRALEGPCDAARVISINFFRWFVRPAGLLREVRTQPKIAAATVLLEGVPESSGASLGAGAAMARDPSGVRASTHASRTRDVWRLWQRERVLQGDRPDILTDRWTFD